MAERWPTEKIRRFACGFSSHLRVIEHMGNMKRAAEASLVAFQEIGDHLAVVESERVLTGRGLKKAHTEHDAIKLALEQADGSVVHAARSLGISFQALTYMLETRHKDLLNKRTPVRRRTRKG